MVNIKLYSTNSMMTLKVFIIEYLDLEDIVPISYIKLHVRTVKKVF